MNNFNPGKKQKTLYAELQGDENPPYSPAEILDYYEEVLRETLTSLEKVQSENNRSLESLPANVSPFEKEDRKDIECLYREISAIIEIAKSSINRKIITSINKRKACEKYNSFCKNYMNGGENHD